MHCTLDTTCRTRPPHFLVSRNRSGVAEPCGVGGVVIMAGIVVRAHVGMHFLGVILTAAWFAEEAVDHVARRARVPHIDMYRGGLLSHLHNSARTQQDTHATQKRTDMGHAHHIRCPALYVVCNICYVPP